MFFSRKDPSTIMSGTNTQCQVLANLIERGVTICEHYSECLSIDNARHPKVNAPIVYAGFSPFFHNNCFDLTAVGCAVLGLEGNSFKIAFNYVEKCRTISQTEDPQAKYYIECSDLLGLPAQLLWDTDFQSYMGMHVPGVIDELRKPQRGYC